MQFEPKNFQNLICFAPFKTIEIDIKGNVRLCGCLAWMPQTVGNIFEQSIQEILENELSRKIRQSIRDGSFIYCNANACGDIANKKLSDKNNLDPLILDTDWYKLYQDEAHIKQPSTYFIAGDETCNLSCPSCRVRVIKNSYVTTEKNHQLFDIINKNLFNSSSNEPIEITLSTLGEVFASNLLLEFLDNFSLKNYPNARFIFQTNGLLLKKRWHRVEHLKNNIKHIVMTTDSCKKATYEKLRRGGVYEDMLDNLEFLSEIKAKFGIKIFLRMVLQLDNSNEIEEFYYWAKQKGADQVGFIRITDWGTYTPEEFKKIDVLSPNHELYQRTTTVLKNLYLKHKDIKILGFSLI